ncbi:hypothetical protein [Agrobacterium tumefaciens]|uniref:hypothetical protein n=1 Tax=Agrobacterium tumefaciens complex TaxID=1183400 RepID=UPI0016591E7C|nr:hypothetical protein [Agrobacterium tumefaciens]QNP81830.1 hypothetical protein IAI05_17845 [Agrobacterium tumefaciens]
MIQPEFSAVVVVAGDRLNLYHLQQAAELIDVGTWQIALKNAIKDYLPGIEPPAPANDAMNGSDLARARMAPKAPH